MSTPKFTGKTSDFLKIGVAAAGRGDVELVRAILKARPKWLHRIGSHGRTMLWEASHKGKLDMVKYLVRRKADMDACGSHYTPYFVEISCYCIARFKKHHAAADFLERKGAIIDVHTAAFLGDLDLLQQLLNRKPSLLNAGHPQSEMLPANDPRGDFAIAEAPWATPLCYALRGGTAETVAFLLKKKARVKGFESQYFIAADEDVEKVRLLLESGADPLVHWDVLPDQKELFALLKKYGKTSARKADSSELVYLCRGDRGGNPEQVQRLLRLGADVNFQDHKGKSALHRAAKSGFVETIGVLIEAGANVDLADPAGETPLFDAVRSTIKDWSKQRGAIQALLDADCDLQHVNKKGQAVADVAKGTRSDKKRKLVRLLANNAPK